MDSYPSLKLKEEPGVIPEQEKQSPTLKLRERPGVLSEQEKQSKEVLRKRRWGGYYVSGLIWISANSFKRSAIDELIILVIALGAWFFYYRLKAKIKVNNETAKIIITFAILYFGAALLIGFLTALADNLVVIAE